VDERISPHFQLSEFLRSESAARHGIDMTPNAAARLNLKRLCELVLEPLRAALGPVHITSGYRPEQLNELIGGARGSAHLDGRAADIVVTGKSPAEVAAWLAASGLPFDQVILEFGRWTHVAVPVGGEAHRRQALTAVHRAGRTIYLSGLQAGEVA